MPDYSAVSKVQDRFDEILKEAMKQPGVAALMAIYDAAETAYANAASPGLPSELTVSSTNAITQSTGRG